MFKKFRTAVVAAALLAAGSLTLAAVAQTMVRGAVSGVTVTPAIGVGLNFPAPAASFSPNALNVSSLSASPLVIVAAPAVIPTVVQPALATQLLSAPAAPIKGSPLALIASGDPSVGVHAKAAALGALFENSRPAADVAGGVRFVAVARKPALRKVSEADILSRGYHFSYSQFYGTMDYAAKLTLNADHTVRFHGTPKYGEPDGLNVNDYILFRGEGTWAFEDGKLTIRANGYFPMKKPDHAGSANRITLNLAMDFSGITKNQFKAGADVPMTGRFSGRIFPNARVGARKRAR